jgi:hypothetical protein
VIEKKVILRNFLHEYKQSKFTLNIWSYALKAMTHLHKPSQADETLFIKEGLKSGFLI